MSTRTVARRAVPSVEQLEDRTVCSVSVPAVVSLQATVVQGSPFVVQVLDTDPGSQVIQEAPSVTVQVAETVNGIPRTVTLGPPQASSLVEVNGVPDLVLQYRGADLSGLVAGPATVIVSATLPDGSNGEVLETFTLQGATGTNAGHTHRPTHHPHPPVCHTTHGGSVSAAHHTRPGSHPRHSH
jgi:hypothetical protein